MLGDPKNGGDTKKPTKRASRDREVRIGRVFILETVVYEPAGSAHR